MDHGGLLRLGQGAHPFEIGLHGRCGTRIEETAHDAHRLRHIAIASQNERPRAPRAGLVLRQKRVQQGIRAFLIASKAKGDGLTNDQLLRRNGGRAQRILCLRQKIIADQIIGQSPVRGDGSLADAEPYRLIEQAQRFDRIFTVQLRAGQARFHASTGWLQRLGAGEEAQRAIIIAQHQCRIAGVQQGIAVGWPACQPLDRVAQFGGRRLVAAIILRHGGNRQGGNQERSGDPVFHDMLYRAFAGRWQFMRPVAGGKTTGGPGEPVPP